MKWTDPEREVIGEAWDEVEAWESYRAAFGFAGRSFEAIRREWYRRHPKVAA